MRLFFCFDIWWTGVFRNVSGKLPSRPHRATQSPHCVKCLKTFVHCVIFFLFDTTPKQQGGKISSNKLCNRVILMTAQILEVSPLGMESGASSRKGCVINGQMTSRRAKNEYTLPPFSLTFPASFFLPALLGFGCGHDPPPLPFFSLRSSRRFSPRTARVWCSVMSRLFRTSGREVSAREGKKRVTIGAPRE